MPVGVIVLLIVAILVYFGLLHRVLDRMRLDDRTALFILFLMILGSFFNLTILRNPALIINIGGALIPIGIAVYLIATADEAKEKTRGVLAAVLSGAAIYGAMKLLNPEEQTMVIDPTYFFGIIAGVIGYLAGRSRRSAFVGGTMGVILADVAHYVEISVRRIPGRTWLGGAGVFDSVVIAGLLGVALAEIVGETREFIARGPLKAGEASGRNEGREEGRDEGPARDGPRAKVSRSARKDEKEDKGDRDSAGGGRDGERGGGGGESFLAAFGVGGGSGRTSGSRDSHRAGRRSRTEPGASQAPGPGVDLSAIPRPTGGSRGPKSRGTKGGGTGA